MLQYSNLKAKTITSNATYDKLRRLIVGIFRKVGSVVKNDKLLLYRHLRNANILLLINIYHISATENEFCVKILYSECRQMQQVKIELFSRVF